MKCTKTLGFIATALMAWMGLAPATAQGGDIWSIEQFSDSETVSRTFPNFDEPLIAGEKVKFRIRLLNRDQRPATSSTYYENPWTLQHVGANDPVVDTNSMPRVGLWISGQLKYAEVEKWYLADKYFTDVICSYTVKAGDLAMPLKLVNSTGTGPAMEGSSSVIVSEAYFVENITKPELWNFFPKSDNGAKSETNEVDLTFAPMSAVSSYTWLGAYSAARNYDLSANNAIYIQAVDFDDTYVDDDKTAWRNIGAGTTSSKPSLPYISIPGGCAESQDLYVWVDNQNIAEMANGTETEYTFKDGTKRKVSRVSIKAGETLVPFKIKGLQKGLYTKVFMAATPTNVYNLAGTLVTNFTMRTIQVIEPPPPYLTVTVTPNDVTTSSEYTKSVATVNVELSQAWTQDLTVKIKMSTKDGTDAWKYLGLSTKDEGDTEYQEQEVTLTVPAEATSSAAGQTLYLYANRADDNSLKGIKFEIDTDSLSTDAKNYFTGTPSSASLIVRPCTPQIAAPVEGYEFPNIPGNATTDFTITVADAKGELENGTYTVYWDNAGTGASYDKITGLKANAKGEIVVPRKYTTAKTYNSRFYVVNEGGAKSDVRTIKVTVLAPKMVTVTPENYPNDSKEGDTLKLKVSFSDSFEEGDASGIGYVWLIPADATTSNLVDCTAINGAGAKIYAGEKTAADMELKLKDGYTGCKLTFTTEVHNADDLKPESLVSSWLGKQFSISVTNVVPTVKQILMNETPMATDGGTYSANVPIGVSKIFKVNAQELGEIDATNENFTTEFKFWENGMVADTVTCMGSPTKASATHAFGAVGLNKVTVRLRDKDMTDQEWADAPEFTAYVNTIEAPAISITPYNGVQEFSESDTGPSKGRINLELTVPPTGLGLSSNITLVVKITRNEADNGNYPFPSLNGSPVLDTDSITTEIKFKNNQTTGYFYFNGLDGTPITESKGFHIYAYVKEETACPADPTKTWKEYYQASDDFDFFVINKDPIIGPGNATTNEIPAAINVPFKIQWTASDITADQTNNFQVTWSYNGGSTTETMDVSKGPFQKEIVFTSSGSKIVTLTVTDKDGGTDTRSYYYKVEASMLLEIYPRGPNSGALAQFTQNYTGAAGLGEGRVWATGADYPSSIANFVQEWSYQPANDLSPHIYAVGYKYTHNHVANADGDKDDGSLTTYGGKDFAIDQNGTWYKDATKYGSYYTYTEADKLDSFFYGWFYKDPEEEDSAHLNGTVQPEVNQAKDFGENTVTMPEYDEEATSYKRTFLEAVFAVELYAEDNLGDLNQDGIPDVFAAYRVWDGGRLYEVAGGTLEEASDVKLKLHNYNDDGDYLPGKVAQGDSIITTAQDWAKDGGEFMAREEIRGFHVGLNYRLNNSGMNYNVRGKWVSEPSFSDAEWVAVARMNPDSGVTEAEVMPDADDRDTALATLKQYIMDTDTSWIPENRTDPTMEDTDADGFNDGYEYFYWYSAMVGEIRDGQVLRLSGTRFSLDDIAVGEVITPEQVAEAFNPTVYADKNKRDTDNDGLYDVEEYALGTNPIEWDSDGDGLSDYWEVLRGMNPAKVSTDHVDSLPDDESNDDADFMARMDTDPEYTIVKIEGLGEYALGVDWNIYVVQDETTGEWTFTENAKSNFTAIAIFRYGDENSECVPKSREAPLTAEAVELSDENLAAPLTVTQEQTLTLLHDQVYNYLGFDPRTGWNRNDYGARGNGPYVSDRWDTSRNSVALQKMVGDTGLAVNTERFTARDEYLLMKYRYETGIRGVDADKADWADHKYSKVFTAGTTNPNVAFEDPDWVTEAMTTTFASDNDGADTDGDGTPDGWELYVGYNPNDNTDTADAEGDGLVLSAEYAGTDSCNAYSGVESIYSTHPGNASGWLNKFFPTDPNDADTDGDTISDGDEGAGWTDTWIYGNTAGATYAFNFIYEGATEDTTTLCFRGGGLNPCSVDTDMDLLPDPWEKQFAGLRFTAGTPVDVTLNASILTLINRGDGVTSGTGNGIYITAGMDGTDPLDAYTDLSTADERTGTVRDYDFDHDGLQNFQEYLVQAVRHFRYDDASTPLMGSWMPDGTPESIKFVKFLPMNIMDGETYYNTCREAGFTATGAWQFETIGYFARPAHEWDRVALTEVTQGAVNYDDMGYRIMLPPMMEVSGQQVQALGYVSTDPRLWDTDQDGMDDFYEMFHGLNPLLGSVEGGEISNDVIAQMYGGYVCNWSNAWTGWPTEAPEDPVFNAISYPWMMGTPEADADGDGLRNDVEALEVNMPSPQPTHTDPTPLWYTDSTSLNNASFVSQYYKMDPYSDTPDFYSYPWSWSVGTDRAVEGARTGTVEFPYMYSFEENEGYDTDGDRLADGDEQTMTATPTSDALKFTDPGHRQALWFPGDQSVAVSYSGNFHRPKGDQYAMLRQFTVEAWIYPEDITREQVIVERVAKYTSSTLSNNVGVVRANFRIGIKADGRLYGMFDNSDAVPTGTGVSSTFAVGTKPETNAWTHVALTYDGSELKFHQNGRIVSTAQTSFIPANGINSFVQDAIPGMTNFPVLVNGYSTLPTAFLIGAQALTGEAIGLSTNTTWDCFANFYKGYVDEVRVWDGARTLTDIGDDYLKSYSFDDVLNARTKIYRYWKNGYTRNDNDGNGNLPPELLQHYSFETLPGATTESDVMWEPSGFTKNVFDNVRDTDGRLPAGSFECGWWSLLPVHSTVYANYAWVPWIQNTCQHLPFMDGSCADSQYWSAFFGGVCCAKEVYNTLTEDVPQIIFPNTANPYTIYNYGAERAYHEHRISYLGNNFYTNVVALYDFELRTGFVGTSDLLPLGGAYAKRMPELWDGDGAADAWELTSFGDPIFDDVDPVDGIPDWWAEVAMAEYKAEYGFDWSTVVTWSGIEMTAREAYLRDLARGMLPGGALVDQFGSRRDDDRDGLPDWWEKLYGIYDENAYDDHDNDGLSNYSEFLITEYFSMYPGFPRVSPLLPASLGQAVPDYYLRVGKEYLGEMFQDHDFIDDKWEDGFSVDYTSRGVYDPYSDEDDDGWDNWSEFQAGTRADVTGKIGIDGATEMEFPLPVIKLSVIYNGKDSFNSEMVVQAWSQENPTDSQMTYLPDATWTIPNEYDATTRAKVLGVNKGTWVTVNMGPGSVVPGTVRVHFADPTYNSYHYWNEDDTDDTDDDDQDSEYTLIGASTWTIMVVDRRNYDDQRYGALVVNNGAGSGVVVGEVNYLTGQMNINLGDDALQGLTSVEETSTEEEDEGATTTTTYNLTKCYVKVSWNSQKTNGGRSATYYLSDSNQMLTSQERDSQYNNNNGNGGNEEFASVDTKTGFLRQGKNLFLVFMDRDQDGKWTAGEPFGYAADVEVGYYGAEMKVELTDTAPQMARIDLEDVLSAGDFSTADALTDRGVAVNGYYTENRAGYQSGTNLPPASAKARMRIVRTTVNGEEFYDETDDTKNWNEVVLDREIYFKGHTALTEADLVADGLVDLDWGTIESAWRKAYGTSVMTTLTNIDYRLVFGYGTIDPFELNNTVPIRFCNVFEYGDAQTKCVPVSPKGTIYGSRPTFKWTHFVYDNEGYKLKDYPAFRLRVLDGTGRNATVIYDSGVQRAPARNSEGTYEWEAPIFAGMITPQGQMYSTTNNYIWQVSMLDAKFTRPNYTNQEFRVEGTGWMADGRRTGSIPINVRYFGPLAEKVSNLKATAGEYQGLTNLLHVQAFTSPDFVGTPVTETYVLDPKTLLDDQTTMGSAYNALLRGLPAGTYYVCAYIDTNANYKRDPWEAWGYVCYVGTASKYLWAPKPITVNEPSVENVYSAYEALYLEDPDCDFDGVPDCWEWDWDAGLDARCSPTGNTYYTKVNTNLVSSLNAFLEKNLHNGKYDAEQYVLNPVLTFLNALDEPVQSSSKSKSLAALIGLPATVTEAGVRIASFSMEEGLVLEAATETTDMDTGVALASTAPFTPITVEWELRYSPTVDGDFSEVVDSGSVSMGSFDKQKINVTFDATKYGKSSGFFKVVIK